MAVMFQHLAADVSGKRANSLLVDAGTLGKTRDERVPKIVPAIAHPGILAGTEPSLAPRTHWKSWIYVVNPHCARIASNTHFSLPLIENYHQPLECGTRNA